MPASGKAADSGHMNDRLRDVDAALLARPTTIKVNGATYTVGANKTIDLGTLATPTSTTDLTTLVTP